MKICDILNNNESENLLKEWLEFREEELSRMDENDQKHLINFDDYSENILNNIDIVEISNYNYNEKISKNLIEWAKKNKDKVTTYIYLYDYFREPFSYHKNANKQLVDDIYKTCIISQKWQCFNVYGEYFYKCPQSLAICKNIEIIKNGSNFSCKLYKTII